MRESSAEVLKDVPVIAEYNQESYVIEGLPDKVDVTLIGGKSDLYFALGISEITDCISVIVSEETGRISIAMNGELHYNLTLDDFKLMLLEELRPKKSIILDEEEGKNNEEE